jgi:rod shape-determining protein MreC
MDTLFSRYRNVMLLVAVLFLQLVMLAFQVKRDRDVPLIRVWAVGVITPVEKLFSTSVRGVVGVWQNYVDLRQARQENRRLSEEVGHLKLETQALREQALEARRLETLLEFKEHAPSTFVAAHVIGSSASETSRVLFIDCGTESGLRKNMAVITPDGVVGKIHRAFRGASQVLVITDPDSGVGALLAGSRAQGVLRGIDGFFCRLIYVVNDEKVEPGERVFTAGNDMIYPKGLPVGVVTAVRNGPLFKEITVQPYARLNRLEEVLVVTRGVDQEIPAAPESAPVAEGVSPQAAPTGAPKAAPGQPAPAQKPPAGVAPALERPGGETDADRLMDAYRAKLAEKAAPPAGAAAKGAAGQPPRAAGVTAPGASGQPNAAKKPAPPSGTPATGTNPVGASAGRQAAPVAIKPTNEPAGQGTPAGTTDRGLRTTGQGPPSAPKRTVAPPAPGGATDAGKPPAGPPPTTAPAPAGGVKKAPSPRPNAAGPGSGEPPASPARPRPKPPTPQTTNTEKPAQPATKPPGTERR